MGGGAPVPGPIRLHAKDCSAEYAAPRVCRRAVPHDGATRQSRNRYSLARTGNARQSAAVWSTDRREPRRSPRVRRGSQDRRFSQRAGQIVAQLQKIASARAFAPDQHQIDSGDRAFGQLQPRGLFQPPPRAVAYHRVAYFLGDREPDPRRSRVRMRQRLNTNPCVAAFRPFAAIRKNSARRFRRAGAGLWGERGSDTRGARPTSGRRSSGRKALAALGAAMRQHPAAADGFHPRPEAMAALANELRRLIGAFHS